MLQLSELSLPGEFRIDSFEINADGGTNDVFIWEGNFEGRAVSVYVKANKHSEFSLSRLCPKSSRFGTKSNYLHFAFWSREEDPAYTSFALDRAMALAELT